MSKYQGIGFWRESPLTRLLEEPRHSQSYIQKMKAKYEDFVEIQPHCLIDETFWETHNKEGVVNYLKKGTMLSAYMGFSNCRLCDNMLGTKDLSDGFFVWPEQFDHYITEHNLVIPEYFYEYIKEHNYEPEKIEESIGGNKIELEMWNEWVLDYTLNNPSLAFEK
jgi:hypothetical protein